MKRVIGGGGGEIGIPLVRQSPLLSWIRDFRAPLSVPRAKLGPGARFLEFLRRKFHAAGAYLLRSNISDWSDQQLWKAYIQLTQAEAAFRIQ